MGEYDGEKVYFGYNGYKRFFWGGNFGVDILRKLGIELCKYLEKIILDRE